MLSAVYGSCQSLTEGNQLRKLGNDMVNVEDLQAGVGVLPLFAVDEAPDGELGRVFPQCRIIGVKTLRDAITAAFTE